MAESGLLTDDVEQIIEVTADPSLSGVAAPVSSIAMLDDGNNTYGLWVKTGTANTAWTSVPSGMGDFTVTYSGSGLVVDYTGGNYWSFGPVISLVQVPAGTITLPANVTNEFIYLPLPGTTVTTGAVPTSYSVPFAMFTTNGTTVTSLVNAKQYPTHALGGATPVSLTPNEGNSIGTQPNWASSDHVHNVPTAAPITQGPDNANADGSAATFARSDHVHNLPAGTPTTINPDSTNSEGTSTSFARADHVHDIPAATAVTLSTATVDAEGTSTSFARADHTHKVDINSVSAEVSTTTAATTTSTTFVAMTTMTDTPAAGTYLVIWSGTVTSSASGATLSVAIFNGATEKTDSLRTCIPFSSQALAVAQPMVMSTQGVVTATGSAAITIQWHTTSGTATVNARTMNLIRIA